ncbi:hypothetical protein MML48_2g00011502 [Holotrichia oblita]|uniref:Uncharacterized protein n=1 Tax=Holotrichia oblita TaxID=644536 RepID=A0ACB9TL37_HOLOL|nr:hypothetical protein MML48_2g00011502 [Holotrichia oblita]
MDLFCRSVVSGIAEKEEIIFPKYEVLPGSEPGDGYLGTHKIVKICGANKCLELFVKFIPDDVRFKSEDLGVKAFHNECLFYETIYPILLEFQRNKDCKILFQSVPRCYKVINLEFNKTIILENILATGYRSFNSKSIMNRGHIEIVLEELGRFHATCFALKDQKMWIYQDIIRNISHPLSEFKYTPDFKRLFDYLVVAARKSLDPTEDREILIVFDKFADKILPFLKLVDSLGTNKYSVINHTDGWCNNFMFKYDDSMNQAKPTNVSILDWQMMMVSLPVIDISYFFYSSGDKTDLDDLQHYLNHYHQCLSVHIEALGSSPEMLYPHAKFCEHWKKYCRYGLIFALLVIKNMLTEKEEVIFKKEAATESESSCDMFMFPIKNDKLYKTRIRNIIIHFVKNGFLDEFII